MMFSNGTCRCRGDIPCNGRIDEYMCFFVYIAAVVLVGPLMVGVAVGEGEEPSNRDSWIQLLTVSYILPL